MSYLKLPVTGSGGGGGGSSTPTEYNAGNSGSAITIDWTNGSQQALTLTANATATLSGGSPGGIYILRLIQDATGGRTITYSPATGTGKVIPQALTFPTLTVGPSLIDIMRFYYDGTYYYLLTPDKNYSTSDAFDGKSVTLDGVSKYIDFGNNSFGVDVSNASSIGIWFKTPSTASSGPLVNKMDSSGNGWELYYGGGQIDFGFFGNGNTLYVLTGVIFSANTWYHLVVTYDGTDANGMKVWVNGSTVTLSVTNTKGSSVANALPCRVGVRNTTRYLAATVDELSFWNAALTSTQVVALYNGGTPNNLASLSFQSNLTNWYRMGDSPDSTSSFTDRKGSVNGTPANIVAADITSDIP